MISMSVFVPGSIPNPAWRPIGISSGTKEALGEFFVDDYHARRGIVRLISVLLRLRVLFGEVPAGQDRHAERCEIPRTDPIHKGIRRFGRLRMIALNRQPAIRFVVFQNSHASRAQPSELPGWRSTRR